MDPKSFQLNDPDVAIEDWVAMVLQMQMALAAGQCEIVMDLDPVVKDIHLGRWFLGVGIDRITFELNVIGLPSERGVAHVDEQVFVPVKAAAFVVETHEAEAVEHLNFVLAVQINAAIASAQPRIS
jgi:hypothetical protein